MYVQYLRIMEIPVINIGNSKGIRLSKSILEQYNISGSIELKLEKGRIILQPKSAPRKGWSEKFRQMHLDGSDKLEIDDIFTDESFEEWK